jgi:hypothetical protein
VNPAIDKGAWTQTEDETLLYYYGIYGGRWSQIRRKLPSKTDNQVKNRFNVIQK